MITYHGKVFERMVYSTGIEVDSRLGRAREVVGTRVVFRTGDFFHLESLDIRGHDAYVDLLGQLPRARRVLSEDPNS